MDGGNGCSRSWGNWIAKMLPASTLRSLLVEGVWGGSRIGAGLPAASAAAVPVHRHSGGFGIPGARRPDRGPHHGAVGLQGKSFIPLLSAYACAVPAILSTRTIENKRDRMATILIAPFMTCSARLPVYTLIIAAFCPKAAFGPLLSARARRLLSLYLLGFLAAVVTARILKSSVLQSGRTPFLLEMPSYRWPTVRSLGLRLYDRSRSSCVARAR